MRPGLNMIVEFVFFWHTSSEARAWFEVRGFLSEREKSLLLNAVSVARRGSFDGCTRANAF